MSVRGITREAIARRAAQDLQDGMTVNLGIGMPTLVAEYVPADREIIYHSENGILGMGPAPAPGEEDRELVNAGKKPVTLLPGGCFFHQSDSFAMTRGGHVDVAIIGAYQVSSGGDLANWRVPGSEARNVGGAMDIAIGVKRLFIMMTHVTAGGEPKLVERCSYPVTARGVVKRVYTDLVVVDVVPAGFILRELVPWLSVAGVQELTGAPLHLPPGGPAVLVGEMAP